jgi:hypothetical protein
MSINQATRSFWNPMLYLLIVRFCQMMVIINDFFKFKKKINFFKYFFLFLLIVNILKVHQINKENYLSVTDSLKVR